MLAAMARNVRLSRMISRTNSVVTEWSNLHFSGFQSLGAWSPSVNLYRYDDRLEVWAELAGVDREEIELDLQPGCLRISGERSSPCPAHEETCRCREVLAMEIEGGRFVRQVALPEVRIEREKVTARLENGLLRVVLPVSPASES